MVSVLVAVRVPLGRLILSLLPLPAAQPFTVACVFTAWIACRMLQQRVEPQNPVGEPVFVVLTVMVVAPALPAPEITAAATATAAAHLRWPQPPLRGETCCPVPLPLPIKLAMPPSRCLMVVSLRLNRPARFTIAVCMAANSGH